MVEGLKKRLADRSLKLCITDKAKELIIERGYDPLYGARPLRRYLQSSVETLRREPSSPAISPRAVRSRWTSKTTNSSAGKTRKSCANESSYSFFPS